MQHRRQLREHVPCQATMACRTNQLHRRRRHCMCRSLGKHEAVWLLVSRSLLAVLGMEPVTTTAKDTDMAQEGMAQGKVQVVEALDPPKLLEGTAATVPLVLLMVEAILEVQAAVVAPLVDLPVAPATAWVSCSQDLAIEASTYTPSSSMSRSPSRRSTSTTAWRAAWHGGRRSAIT